MIWTDRCEMYAFVLKEAAAKRICSVFVHFLTLTHLFDVDLCLSPLLIATHINKTDMSVNGLLVSFGVHIEVCCLC